MCNNSQGTHYIPEGRWQLNMFNDYKNTIDKLLLQLFRPTVTIKRTVNMPITYALLAGKCTSLCICTCTYICLKTCIQSYPLLIQYAAVQYACTVNTAAKVHSVRINTAHMNYFLFVYIVHKVYNLQQHTCTYVHAVWAAVVFAVHRECVKQVTL